MAGKSSMILGAVVLLFAFGCSGFIGTSARPMFDLDRQCWSCAGVVGSIESNEYELQALTHSMYVATDAKMAIDPLISITADQIALNTRTGVFMTDLMTGRISNDTVEVIVKKGSLLDVDFDGPAEGNAEYLLMTGGGTITMGGASVKAPNIVVKFF